MATLMQGQGIGQAVEHATREDVVAALRPWRRRVALRQGTRWIVGGIIAGTLLACVVLVVARLVPWGSAPYWALGVGVACILLSCAGAIWYRPTLAGAARRVDRHLALQDRLSTAWELRNESHTLAQLQRDDALEQLRKQSPRRAITLKLSRAMWLVIGLIALALVLLIVLPNPQLAILKQQAAFQARITKQVAALDKLRQLLAQQATTPAEQQEQKQIDQVLRNLEAQLQQAKNDTQAQQALAQAQAKLDQLHNPNAANQEAARLAASAALQNGSNSSDLNALGTALANNDAQGLASALKSLSSQLDKLSAAQRSQLAQELEKAANQASQDPSLSASLHQLAKSITDGNQAEVADANNAVQAAAAQSAATQAQENSVKQAEQGVQQSANSLAAATDSSTNQGQSQAQGNGQQQGQGNNQGQGNGQGQGQGGQGTGGQGGSNGAGNNAGKDEQVFVPGQIGSGLSTQHTDGSDGTVQPGNQVPYSQVIQEYSQMAHDAIDNSDIPPAMKDLVRNYFDALEGQQ